MATNPYADIPWRRNEVETLHDFLVSAKNRGPKKSQNELKHLDDRPLCRPLLLGNGNGTKLCRYLSNTQTIPPRNYRKSMTVKDLETDGETSYYMVPTPCDVSATHRPTIAANIFILRGQTGCGKVSTVRRLCNDLGLKILEYDPFEIETMNYSGGECYEAVTATLLRFLDTARRKPGLRMTSVTATRMKSTSSGRSNSPTPRWIKRIKLAMDTLPSTGEVTPQSGTDHNEPHIILLKDLPRGILNSQNSDSVKRIQTIMQRILEGNHGTGDIASFPVLICVNNSESDRLMLKALLPWNYETHPRCLRLNITQITKPKMKIIFSKHLRSLGQAKNVMNEQLIDIISGISYGDIRYGLNNLHFFSTALPTRSDHVIADLAALKSHMLERNTSNGVFKLLGKVLVNKRVPVILRTPADNPRTSSPQDTIDHAYQGCERFNNCFRLSHPVSRLYLLSLPQVHCPESPDYSDVIEILPTLSDDFDGAGSSYIELEDHSQDSECDERKSEPGLQPYEMVKEPSFEGSLLSDLSFAVRMFGLKEPFNMDFPVSMCLWPTITYDLSATPVKYPRGAMLPRVTRPGMYYVPEELLDSGYAEGSFLANCCFENYVQYFECMNDCAVMATQLCFADVYLTSARHTGGQSDEFMEQMNRTFSSICIRATSDSNLGAKEVSKSKGFRHFGRNIWQSESRYDMERLQELYDSHLRDLVASMSRTGHSRYPGSAYMCKQRAFVELVPFMYMLLSQDTAVESPPREVDLDVSLNMSNIMTESMMEQIDMLIDRCECPPRNSSKEVEPILDYCGVLSSVTPKFKQLLTEIGKRY